MDWDKVTLAIALVLALFFLGGRLPSGMSLWVLGNRTDPADRARTRLTQEARILEPREDGPVDQAK